MKRILAFFLALVMLFGMVPSLGTVAKAETESSTEEVTSSPFYGLTWSPVEMSLYGNLEDAPVLTVSLSDDGTTLSMTGSSDFAAKAASLKTTLDALPEGMRYIRIQHPGNALKIADHVVYADEGVAQLKALVTNLLSEYYDIGGQLDGIITDTEYVDMGSWYIYSWPYGGYYTPSDEKIEANNYNRNIYHDIVNDERYLTEIRPLLEERGFAFYDYENASGYNADDRSEIWSMFPPQVWSSMSDSEEEKFNTYYTNCYSIWNRVMDIRIAEYMNEAMYEPLIKYYPDATLSDYKTPDTATWEHYMSEGGGLSYYVGNSVKYGNVSDMNMYNSGPNSGFFVDGSTYLYNNIQSYNNAIYDDDAYGSMLFNVNRFKSIYAATDTKMISAWIAEYDYSGRNNSVKDSAYYTEVLYHIGMLNPLPFKIYMYTGSGRFSGTEGSVLYNARMEVISQILDELTRVAGYSDRQPIETPQSWNDGFALSGMYANGRNIWRLTPDTTDGMTLEDFKVSSSTPTFSINGNTITFPGGKILADSTISTVGSCGYWIETAADVQPVITREDDRYANNPSFELDFDDYETGDIFNRPDNTPLQVWTSDSVISSTVSLSGTASQSISVPTAASAQTWEAQFTIPYSKKTSSSTGVTTEVALTETAEMALLTCGNDGGIKIVNNQVYYDSEGSYVLLEDVTLTAGSTYRVRRVIDFDNLTCDYSIHEKSGALIAEVEDVAMQSVSAPVSAMGVSVNNFQATTTKTASDGTVNSTTTADQTLSITAAYAEEALRVEDGALALTGTATLNNVKIPKNITAGDSYAMQQAWELSFTLSEALSEGTVTLFNGLVKLENSKIYYSQSGSYVEMADLTVGTKYTINVNNDFDTTTATYTLSADGTAVATAESIAVTAVTLPVETITMAATGLTSTVLIDDYKLYPTGLEYTLKCFDGNVGIYQETTENLTNSKVAYRLSWMNATSAEVKGQVRVARYDEDGALVSDEVVETIEMTPYWDGVATGVLENTTASLTVYLHICERDNTELKNQVDATCTTAGYTGDLYCVTCGELYEAGSAIVATGHTKQLVKGKSPTCTADGLTTGYICSVCGEVLTAQTVIPATGHTITVVTEGYAATCTTDGKTDKTKCTVCGTIWNATTIPATGHTESDPVKENIVEGSCTQDASYDLVVYCATCGEEISRETVVDATAGHTEETVEGYAATCTTAGLTDGKVCSVCGEVIEEQTVIPATGHTEQTTVTTVDATCGVAGSVTTTVTCSVCGELISESVEEIPALEHTPADAVTENAVAPSYDVVVYCSTCGAELSRESFTEYTVTLWGTAYTIAEGDTSVMYWVNGAEGEAPVAATAEDDWNYSYALVDGVPTVTVRNAEYSYAATFLNAKFDGSLVLAYEGENEFYIPYKASSGYAFAYYTSASKTSGKGKLYVKGADDAVMNITGGSKDVTMLNAPYKAYLYFDGGTFNIERTNAGGVNPVVSTNYGKVYIENCNLTIKNNTGVSNQHAAFNTGGAATITDSNVTVEANTLIGMSVGIFGSNMQGVVNLSTLTINGKSNVKVVNTQVSDSYSYSGMGIYAKNIVINGGSVEATALKQAVYTTGSLDLSGYDGSYEMYIAEDGEAVTAYATSTYFRIKYLCEHEEEVIPGKAATCTESGLTDGAKCTLCNAITVEQEVIEALGHTEVILEAKDATCTETGLTAGVKCSVCGEIITAQEVIEALGHTEAVLEAKDATCTTDGLTEGKQCTTCGETLVEQTVITAPGHTTVELAAKDATCTEDGLTAGIGCSVCGEVLSGQTVIPATGHMPMDAVKENVDETAATYESVIYCSVCGGEISRTTVGILSGTVTLFGTEVTVDNDDSTTDVPEALYWINGEDGGLPTVGTADNWNYRFTIIEGVPTVTLRNAEYSYAATFLYAKYDGKLALVYEGENNMYVPYKASSGYQFLYYASSTNSPGKGEIYVEGAEDATLTVTGGSKDMALFQVANKAYLTVSGGTISITKTNAGGTNAVFAAGYSKTTIENCNLTVINSTSVSSATYPAIVAGYTSGNNVYGITINDSNVRAEGYTMGGLCAGVWLSNCNGVSYATTLTINGNSTLKVSSGQTNDSYAANGTGIYAKYVIINGGSVEATALKQAVYTTGSNAPDLSGYDGSYEMYTTEGGEAVTEYTATTYFKVEKVCEHTDLTTTEEITLAATCSTAGVKTVTATCACGQVISQTEEEIAALGHIPVALPAKDATCTETGLTAGKGCLTCGEALIAQTVIPALGHSYTDVTDIDCDVCGAFRPTVTVDGNAVSVHLNGVASAKTHTFYVENAEISDINNWSELKATGTLKTYSVYEFTLATAGDYVLRLEYYDTEGVRSVASYPATIEETNTAISDCAPKFTVNNNLVTVDSNGAVGLRVHAFYVEGVEVADINYWSALKAADPNFKTYSKNIIPLTKVGKYVLRAEYSDTAGTTYAESTEIYVDCVPVSLSVDQQKVTVNVNGATDVRVYAFFVEEGESVSNIYDWYELKTVDPEFKTYVSSSFKLPQVGRYVLRVQYVDPQGVTRAVSFMGITTLITPEATVSGYTVKFTTNGTTVNKVHVFNVDGQDIADITDWYELKAEANTYKAYAKTPITLSTKGTYVLRIEFTDIGGNARKISQQITIGS